MPLFSSKPKGIVPWRKAASPTKGAAEEAKEENNAPAWRRNSALMKEFESDDTSDDEDEEKVTVVETKKPSSPLASPTTADIPTLVTSPPASSRLGDNKELDERYFYKPASPPAPPKTPVTATDDTATTAPEELAVLDLEEDIAGTPRGDVPASSSADQQAHPRPVVEEAVEPQISATAKAKKGGWKFPKLFGGKKCSKVAETPKEGMPPRPSIRKVLTQPLIVGSKLADEEEEAAPREGAETDRDTPP